MSIPRKARRPTVATPARGWSPGNDDLARAAGYEGWQTWALEEAAAQGYDICGARNKRKRPCRRHPITHRTRCPKHGGKTLPGLANPNATHLRYSKYIPGRLREAYEESLARGDQLNLDRQIAMCDTRETELWKRLDTGKTESLWPRIGVGLDQLDRAMAAADTREIEAAISNLMALALVGEGQQETWLELRENADARRRLVNTEVRRLAVTEDTISRARLAVLTVKLADGFRQAIEENVSDEIERRRALHQLSQFTFGLLEASDTGREIKVD